MKRKHYKPEERERERESVGVCKQKQLLKVSSRNLWYEIFGEERIENMEVDVRVCAFHY